MNKPTIDEVLAPKPDARPRIYAYAIADAAHHCIQSHQGLTHYGLYDTVVARD